MCFEKKNKKKEEIALGFIEGLPKLLAQKQNMPVILIPLYIRGMIIPVSQGSTLLYAPNDTPEEETVKVTVEGISFIIARNMVVPIEEEDEDTEIPLAKGFFDLALRNGADTIDIGGKEHDDKLAQARYYPVVFDYLLRRLCRSGKQEVADYHMERFEARHFHELMDVLFHIDDKFKLPTTANGLKVCVAIMPEATPNSLHELCTDLCVEPNFVRLVQELQDAKKSTNKKDRKRRRETLREVCDKHCVVNLPMYVVEDCVIETIERGTRFVLEIKEDSAEVGTEKYDRIMVVEERLDYGCA